MLNCIVIRLLLLSMWHGQDGEWSERSGESAIKEQKLEIKRRGCVEVVKSGTEKQKKPECNYRKSGGEDDGQGKRRIYLFVELP